MAGNASLNPTTHGGACTAAVCPLQAFTVNQHLPSGRAVEHLPGALADSPGPLFADDVTCSVHGVQNSFVRSSVTAVLIQRASSTA